MNSDEEEKNKKNISTSLVLACIFKSPEIKYSNEFIQSTSKNEYGVSINYIKYIIDCINRLFILHTDSNIALRDHYKMEWQSDSNNATIKRVIDTDKRLKPILTYTENYIVYTGREIVLEKFVDKKDADLSWFADKMVLYANRIIEEKTYGEDNILKRRSF